MGTPRYLTFINWFFQCNRIQQEFMGFPVTKSAKGLLRYWFQIPYFSGLDSNFKRLECVYWNTKWMILYLQKQGLMDSGSGGFSVKYLSRVILVMGDIIRHTTKIEMICGYTTIIISKRPSKVINHENYSCFKFVVQGMDWKHWKHCIINWNYIPAKGHGKGGKGICLEGIACVEPEGGEISVHMRRWGEGGGGWRDASTQATVGGGGIQALRAISLYAHWRCYVTISNWWNSK